MIGTLANAGAVMAGGVLGLLIKKGIKESLSDACMKAVGVVTMLIGLSGALAAMLVVGEDGHLSAQGALLLLISLVIGTILGELLRLHDRVESLSAVIGQRLQLGDFSKGFISASVLFCAGAMTIVGAINDGLYGEPDVLFLKSAIDGISALFLAAALGAGVLFSAAFVLVYQGALTLCAGLLAPVMTPSMMNALNMVGYAIVLCIGLNLAGATKIKVTNMVFALPIAALLSLIPWLS